MAKYRKKSVVIEAVRLDWNNWNEVRKFADVSDSGGKCYLGPTGQTTQPGDACPVGLIISTLTGKMIALEGDWIIKGVAGELYPCRSDIFEKTYDLVVDE